MRMRFFARSLAASWAGVGVRTVALPVAATLLMVGGAQRMVAQSTSGITGTVTDASGSIIPGAQVEIQNNATGVSTNVVTSSAGTYSAPALQPGRYKVTVTAPGFSKSVKDQVNVEVSTQATIDFSLVAGTDTVVEVTAPLIALNTTQPELGTTIEPAVVQALPVAIGGGRTRQVDQLQFTAPGVQGDTFSHQTNGGVNFQTEILYDGIPAPQSETAGYTTNFNPPFDLVGQFRVERTTFSAKYGLAQGAVSYSTASGTNKLHGNVFYINRNEAYDAQGFFNTQKPIDRENNYGFTVAGPVVIPHLYNGKDKTFFQFSLDFGKSNQTNTNIGTVPTALEKTGDFSDFIDPNTGRLIPIYDPQTGQQFQYMGRLNVINPARISALAASIIPSIPDPDRPGLNNNKNYSPNAFPLVQHIWGFTIDHSLTPTQSLHYAEWRNTYQNTGFDNSPIVPVTNILQSAKNNPALGTVFLLNYTNTLTPRLVMTAGVDWVGEINNQFNVKRGVSFAGVAANPIADTFPNITFSGNNSPTTWGTNSGWVQSINRKLGIAAVNNWLWTKGRHTLNIGGEMRRTYQDDNECQACAGQFNFSAHQTATSATLGTSGSPFASFLLGQVDSADRIFANELALRNLLIAPYVQDDIKVTPKLTVNLGVRWDIMLPFTEKNNQIVYLNPTEPNSAAGNLPGTANKFGTCSSSICSGVTRGDIHFRNFGPRVGFAYQISNRTVVQAGYSLTYLDGGAFEYGTSKVATTYGNLLQGSYNANSTGNVNAGYGNWDSKQLPSPNAVALTPALGVGTRIEAFDVQRAGRAPYLQQWNANFQQQLPWNTFLQVAYVGNRALHLNGQLNPISQPNPSILSYGSLLADSITDPAAIAAGIRAPYANYATDLGGNATVAHTLSPYPQYSRVFNNYDLTGTAAYNGLQISLEKRFSNGLSFLSSYTLSRTLANVDSGFTTFASLPENKYNQKAEYTVSGNDVLNNAKLSGTYELPIGPGKSLFNNKGITGQVLGGFQVGFILTYYTGTPYGISENDNPLGCDGCFNRPNVVSGQSISSTNYSNLGFETSTTGNSTRKVLNTAAFVSTSGSYTLGNAVRNYATLRQPGNYREDVSAEKKFALGERVTFSLRADFFNVLNRTRFNGPDSNVDDSNFGLVGAGQQNSPRNGQVSGRITF